MKQNRNKNKEYFSLVISSADYPSDRLNVGAFFLPITGLIRAENLDWFVAEALFRHGVVCIDS